MKIIDVRDAQQKKKNKNKNKDRTEAIMKGCEVNDIVVHLS